MWVGPTRTGLDRARTIPATRPGSIALHAYVQGAGRPGPRAHVLDAASLSRRKGVGWGKAPLPLGRSSEPT
jgi:hypothetical protein